MQEGCDVKPKQMFCVSSMACSFLFLCFGSQRLWWTAQLEGKTKCAWGKKNQEVISGYPLKLATLAQPSLTVWFLLVESAVLSFFLFFQRVIFLLLRLVFVLS